jgi:hypothetical protein
MATRKHNGKNTFLTNGAAQNPDQHIPFGSGLTLIR